MSAANVVTGARLVLSPAPLLLVGPLGPWGALSAFAVLAGSDAVDGWLARRFAQPSDWGARMDPIADKATLLFGLAAIGATPVGAEPWFVAAAILLIAREAAMGAARLGGIVRAPAAWPAKVKTALQMLAVGGLLVPVAAIQAAAGALLWIAVAASIWTAIDAARAARLWRTVEE